MTETTAQAQQAPTEAAGQELDARVERLAFGYVLERAEEGQTWLLYDPKSDTVVDNGPVRLIGTTEAEAWKAFAQPYSTDLNHAMRAAEAVGLFDENQHGMTLYKGYYHQWTEYGDIDTEPVYHRDYIDVWCVGGVCWGYEAMTQFTTGETSALAIARAVVAVASQRAQEGQGEGR